MLNGANCCGAVPTRSAKTIESYRDTYRQLMCRAAGEVEGDLERLTATVRWLGERRDLSSSTVRQYRAALRQAVEDIKYGLDVDDFQTQRLLDKLSATDTPRFRPKEARTSAKKRKTCSFTEVKSLLTYLESKRDMTSKILCGMIGYGVLLGLRPSEWQHSEVAENILVVKNGKNSNGRSFGPIRRLGMQVFKEDFIVHIRVFLVNIRSEIEKSGSWQRVYSRIAKALLRACKNVGIDPICLYTLRHQFSANAKAVMDRRQVAALMGHASDRTAGRHYARRRSGWKIDSLPAPAPTDILSVRVSHGTYDHGMRTRNMQQRS